MTTTARRLIKAAAALLDSGGESAVTLRAVGQAAGVSHNAPYKHFLNRSALLAAVAAADFEEISKGFRRVANSNLEPRRKLIDALKSANAFRAKHPARYKLLFSDPALPTEDPELKVSAMAAFNEFLGIVRECQASGVIPNIPSPALSSLLFAAMHGLIALESSGRMHPDKGLTGVETSIELLIDLISPAQGRSK